MSQEAEALLENIAVWQWYRVKCFSENQTRRAGYCRDQADQLIQAGVI